MLAMKIILKNLGHIKKVECEVGDLTVLCGENNAGKTQTMCILYEWLTYVLNGRDYQKLRNQFCFNEKSRNRIKNSKQFSKFVKQYFNDESKYLRGDYISIPLEYISIEIFSGMLKIIVADFVASRTNKDLPQNPDLSFEIDEDIFNNMKKMWVEYSSEDSKDAHDLFYMRNGALVTSANDGFSTAVLWVTGLLIYCYFIDLLKIADIYIFTVERYGITMFSNELNIQQNAIIAHLIKNGKATAEEIRNLMVGMEYPVPITDNISFFTKELKSKREDISFIVKEHPEILEFFEHICGGKINFREYGIIDFTPHKSSKNISLQISSSSVRAMVHLGFYLYHLAKKGDILMIDEPELNLHPAKQRLMAQIIAMLINVGVKVMLTTHSDYVINEFNSLIMLKKQKEKNPTKINKIMKKYGYSDLMLLDANQCKATIAKNNNKGFAEFSKLEVDDFWGIDTTNFDDTIATMSDIKEQIITV
jgi:hypothetical protein